MSATVSHYSSRSKANSRLDGVKASMDRSSAYIYGSSAGNRSSMYDTLKRESSFTSDTGRLGRSRTRDHSSLDFSAKPRRSSSLELSAGPAKARLRDRSTDFSINHIDRVSARPKTTIFDSKYDAKEYKDLTSSPDKYLTLQKYRDYDKTKEMNSTVEEERRGKAYSKIINSASTYAQEQDANRACMSDIFMNTDGFSTKTVNAIAREVIYKEEKGPRNYSWRKDMESYEEKLEVLTAHKRVVHDSTRATRDVPYRSTDSKIRDYDRETRRNVDSVSLDLTPTTRSYSSNTNATTAATSNGYTATEHRSAGSRVRSSEPEYTEPTKKGSWRKNLEKYESELELKKVQQENQKKIESYSEETKSFQVKPSYHEQAKTESKPEAKPTYSWKRTATEKSLNETAATTNSWQKPAAPSTAPSPRTATVSVSSDKSSRSVAPQSSKSEETKTSPTWKKSEPAKTEEPKVDATKPVPTWKQPEPVKKEEPKVEEAKPAPSWKKPVTTKTEEPKPETPKPAPKWKKSEPVKKEEPKAEEAKPAPSWKKPVTTKTEEPKPETPKPAPKWKKPATTAIKTEEKAEEKKAATPKWKKPESVKKVEPVVEEPKPVPKWKKTAKTEEPKPAEEPKPVPKWKKPASTKPEEPAAKAPEAAKPVPATKKLSQPQKEEQQVEKGVEEEKALAKEPAQAAVPPEAAKNENEADNQKEAESSTTEEKKKEEEEEEEDTTGMRAMRKETANKFSDLDAEMTAGRSKLAALRAKMKALREKSKAQAAADAAA